MGFKVLLMVALLLAVVESQTTTLSTLADIEENAEKEANNNGATPNIAKAKLSESGEKHKVSDSLETKERQKKKEENDILPPEVIEALIEEKLVIDEDFSDAIANNEERNGDGSQGIDRDDYSPDTVNRNTLPNPDVVKIRRQGDVAPEFGQRQVRPTTQSDSREERKRNNPIRYPQPLRAQRRMRTRTDSTPLLQLTQGGYQRPYQNSGRSNDREQGTRSESTENVETPSGEKATEERPVERQVAPQVTYTTSFQPHQFSFGQGPVLRPAFGSLPRGFLNANGIIPGTAQSSVFNTPPNPFLDFTTANFQSQFPSANDVGAYPSLVRDPNSISLFQAVPRNVFPNNGFLFQNNPQFAAPQPVMVNPQRSLPLPDSSIANYPTFETVEDASRPDYAAYFRNPTSNPQLQATPTFFATNQNPTGDMFANPPISLLSNFQSSENATPFSSRYLRYPMSDVEVLPQINVQSGRPQQQSRNSNQDEKKVNDSEQINQTLNIDDQSTFKFGARLQTKDQNGAPKQNEAQLQDNVYMRYPTNEAGYATEEILPSGNITEEDAKNRDVTQVSSLPFLVRPRQFGVPRSRDPYRDALNAVHQAIPRVNGANDADANGTYEFPTEQFVRNRPLQFDYPQMAVEPPAQVFATYPDRSQDGGTFPNMRFYPSDGARIPFDQLTTLPENSLRYQDPQTGLQRGAKEEDKIPRCAQKNNASLCFEDEDYPKRELMYVLNSDSFLLERLVMPDQELDKINLLGQNNSEDDTKTEENYICKSDIKYGTPLRAKNVLGKWKVIVNMERAIGRGRFIQPVRLEVCRESGEPCSYTDNRIKTTCVQKFTLQRFLSWSPERGVHNDVYKLPVACSCQIVEEIEA